MNSWYETDLIAITLINEMSNPLNWMIKIAPIVSYNAIPSMFIVAPKGATNLDTFRSIPILSRHLIVTGTVAVLDNVLHYLYYQ